LRWLPGVLLARSLRSGQPAAKGVVCGADNTTAMLVCELSLSVCTLIFVVVLLFNCYYGIVYDVRCLSHTCTRHASRVVRDVDRFLGLFGAVMGVWMGLAGVLGSFGVLGC